jgi:hypothetical protein
VSSAEGLAAVDRIIDRGGEADAVLREIVAVLHGRYSWVGIAFVEGDALVLGPASGEPPAATTGVPISYDGKPVAELRVAGQTLTQEDAAFLERIALSLAPYCLVGWDTGGEAWSP